MGILYLAVAIAAEVAATLSLRLTTGDEPRWWAWIVVVCGYVVSFGSLQRSLATGFSLPIAYAIWSGVGVVAVAALSYALFREGLTLLQIGGMVLVIAGVLLLELGGSPGDAG